MAVKFRKTSNGGIPAVATVQNPRTTGVFNLTVDTQQFWPTGAIVDFSTYKVDANNKRIAGSQTDWTATSDGTSALSGMTVVGGAADAGNAVGDKVQMGPTAWWAEGIVEGLLNQHNNDGTHSNVTAVTVAASGAISAGSLSTSGALTANTATVTNKLTVGTLQLGSASVASVDGSSNLTPTAQIFDVTAMAANGTLQLPSFTPWNGAGVVVSILATGAFTLALAAAYENVSGLPWPGATISGKYLTVGIIYRLATTKWHIVSISQES